MSTCFENLGESLYNVSAEGCLLARLEKHVTLGSQGCGFETPPTLGVEITSK